MPTTIKLESPIFDKQKRQQAFSNAVSKATREYAAYVPKQQVESRPSGKLYKRKRGATFVRSHRASAKGQKPSPDSGKLIRTTKHKKTGPLTGEVITEARKGGFDYAAQLEDKMDRPIQSASSDVKAAQDILNKNAEAANAKLV